MTGLAASRTEAPVVAIFRSPVFNASETFIQTQALALQRYRPLIVGLEDKGHVAAALRERTLIAGNAPQRLAFKLFGAAGGLLPRLRAHAPVLIHAHFAPDGLLALGLARTLRIPLVTTLHGYDVTLLRRAMLTSGRLGLTKYALHKRRLLTGGQLFLAVSDAIRRHALAAGYPPERTVTHYIGVDLQRWPMSDMHPQPGLVLHVGRLVEKKGTALLLAAFAKLKASASEASLVIVGDGPLRAALEQQASALGIAAAVRFTGMQTPDEVAAWMRRAWLLAAPSLRAADGDAEGLPTVVLEAASCGVPVIGSDHTGIPEAILDGQTGLIVPEGDADALATRMGELLASAERRYAMAHAARSMAERRFDTRRQTRQLEAYYDSLRQRPEPSR
jgi:colanic acid/amylovoran biosynthesis glycosyltransferase